jgi:hypothetical protein
MTFLVVKVNTYRLLLPHHDLVKVNTYRLLLPHHDLVKAINVVDFGDFLFQIFFTRNTLKT